MKRAICLLATISLLIGCESSDDRDKNIPAQIRVGYRVPNAGIAPLLQPAEKSLATSLEESNRSLLSNFAIPAAAAGFKREAELPSVSVRNRESEQTIAVQCGLPTNQELASLKGATGQDGALALLLPFFVKIGLEFFVDEIDKALQAEVKLYSAAYKSSVRFPSQVEQFAAEMRQVPRFYYTTSPAKSLDPVWGCVRLIRPAVDPESGLPIDRTTRRPMDLESGLVLDEKTGKPIPGKLGEFIPALDLILQMRIVPEKDAMQIRPLRIFLGSSAAKTKRGGEVAVVVTGTMNSTWRKGDNGESSSVELFKEESLLKAKFKCDGTDEMPLACSGNKSKSVIYYFDKPWERYPLLPLVPKSVSDEPGATTGIATLSLTIAEAGEAPSGLKVISKVVSKSSKDIKEALTGAFDSVLDSKGDETEGDK